MRLSRFKIAIAGAVVGASLAGPLGSASADSIYVMGSPDHVDHAFSHLTNLGHAVTIGGARASYAGYDQVWDLRLPLVPTDTNTLLDPADVAAMGAYLQGGGRMYLAGEWAAFDLRNDSLITWIDAVGGGALSFGSALNFLGEQEFTTAGQALNTADERVPFNVLNPTGLLPSVVYSSARTVTDAGSGFLVTEVVGGEYAGQGSMVGWDFGDIAGASGARMLVGFDINVFGFSDSRWTEDAATWLGAAVPESVPAPGPSAFGLFGLSLLVLAWVRRRFA